MAMPVYQSDPEAAPDFDFEPGSLHHLVPGNRGRMLDPRRTPISVVGLEPEAGFMVIRVDAFEDEGATWQIPFERVDRFQFARGSAAVPDADCERFREAIERFGRPMPIEPDPDQRTATERRISAAEAGAGRWLRSRSRFIASGHDLPDHGLRRSDELLFDDVETFMRERGYAEMEQSFARSFVGNPSAGEVVKGHAIVLAEAGLAAYGGTGVRDPATFAGTWSRHRRLGHVVARLGYVRALLRCLGPERVTLWRGLTTEKDLEPERRRTFVSTTFSERVARSHFEGGSQTATCVLVRRAVPLERILMTYPETRAMNERFLEAEAVVLSEPGDGWL